MHIPCNLQTKVVKSILGRKIGQNDTFWGFPCPSGVRTTDVTGTWLARARDDLRPPLFYTLEKDLQGEHTLACTPMYLLFRADQRAGCGGIPMCVCVFCVLMVFLTVFRPSKWSTGGIQAVTFNASLLNTSPVERNNLYLHRLSLFFARACQTQTILASAEEV